MPAPARASSSYVRNRTSGDVWLVSKRDEVVGTPTGSASSAFLSGDGTSVLFASRSSSLRADICEISTSNVFLRDLTAGPDATIPVRVSLPPCPCVGCSGCGSGCDYALNNHSTALGLNGDGTKALFSSIATDLFGIDNSARNALVLYDDGAFSRVNTYPAGGATFADMSGVSYPEISENGRYVTFSASDPDELCGPSEQGCGAQHLFRKDLDTGALECIDTPADVPHSPCANEEARAPMSGDGRFIAFNSAQPDLDPLCGGYEVFVKDMSTGEIACLSLSVDGEPSGFARLPEISADGAYVTFLAQGQLLPDVPPAPGGEPRAYRVANPLYAP